MNLAEISSKETPSYLCLGFSGKMESIETGRLGFVAFDGRDRAARTWERCYRHLVNMLLRLCVCGLVLGGPCFA